MALGIWIIPFTFFIAPCRRLVHLVAKLQQLHDAILRPSSSLPSNVWSRMASFNHITLTI
ncbi:hypothetical protein KSP39_PZI022915 [Platanthera zijinensis]|uniref:Uncharacterized protein n=2 Tax=Platanthera TaxID=59352 RepID=A0AAP0AUB5_9ASPA